MYSMFQDGSLEIVLYTDALVTRGKVRTGQHRISDLLNQADEAFLVLEDVTVDELGSRGSTTRSDYAQVNLDAVLFAVATTDPPTMPELRTMKQPTEAMISIPPFKVTGKIHLMPTEGLRQALGDLTGRFFPITDAAFWSDQLHEPREQAPMLAVNHRRAQILAPYRVVDPWAGDAGGSAGGSGTVGGPDAPTDPSGF
ncbi:MAG TPA: hypothetical protein VGM28_08290 [Candidatus Limnocylindrales bacterium]|jgi:hypothetical protein